MGGKRAVPAPFTKGVNFTNWMEFRRAEEINPKHFTKQDFQNAKKLGCDVIRIPMHFEKICEGIPDMKIPDNIFGILDNVAAWAEELQMYIIFDYHNNCHVDSVTSPEVEQVLTPIWTQLATRYKDATEYNSPLSTLSPSRSFSATLVSERRTLLVCLRFLRLGFSIVRSLPFARDSQVSSASST